MGFNGTSKAGSTGKNVEPVLYVRGLNAHLDAIIGDDTVWIVTGTKGRRPIIADTKEEAVQIYADSDYLVVSSV